MSAISQLIQKNFKKDRYTRFFELMPDFNKEKTQKYVTIILTLTASIILGIFAVSPTISTIVTLQKQLDDDKFIDQKLQEKINNLSILQQKYAGIQNDLPVILDAVPKTSQIPLLVAQIQGLTNETNVTIVSFQTFPIGVSNDNNLNKRYSSYDFAVIVQGDYHALLNFLDKLSNFQRIVTLNDLSITKTVEQNTSFLRLSIKGSAYFKN